MLGGGHWGWPYFHLQYTSGQQAPTYCVLGPLRNAGSFQDLASKSQERPMGEETGTGQEDRCTGQSGRGVGRVESVHRNSPGASGALRVPGREPFLWDFRG